MKRLLCVLAVLSFLAAPAMAETISVGDYIWDVTQSNSITIAVNVSGGSQISAASVFFAVGDGGPEIGGTEQIQISAVGYGDGTIWAGQTLTGSGPTEPLPVGAAVNVNVLESWTTSSHPTVTASGTLMTITLQAPPGGLTSEIGEKLTLDPNLFDSTSLANGASYPALTFVTGQLTLVPEPSTGVMLLILGGVLFGWRCCRSRKSR